jgi:glycosyltransferase involved in cell wall biosynthesis
MAVNSHNNKKTVLRMITVASLIPRKNVSFILSALVLCQKRGLDFEFVVIGDGEEYSKLVTFSEQAKIGKNIKFLGQLGPEDVAQELSKTPIFITSSRHEGRPNVVVEAMAAGACVLASNISGHRELIKDTEAGLIFELKSAEDLADLLCDLAKSPSQIKLLGNKARNYIVENGLTWDASSNNYRTLFESLKSDR